MMEQDVEAIQAALRKQGVITEKRTNTSTKQQRATPSYVTLGECCEILGLNLPKLHRLLKEHRVPIKRNQRDKRTKYIDLNEVKRILAS